MEPKELTPEVVDTWPGCAFGPGSPLLILDRLVDFLDANDLGAGPVSWQRVGDGQSNVTYKLERDGLTAALRRGPRPPFPSSTHDMLREARIMGAVRRHGIPTPEVLAIEDDLDILGVPFYLTQWLDGAVITSTEPPRLAAPAARHAVSEALVLTLADLHLIDATDPGVASLGRPHGFLRRQIDRFAGLWGANGGRALADVDLVADWLEQNLPDSDRHSLVHGDYRLGNLMFEPIEPSRPLAVLDWEMATVGDPLTDLGYLIATYSDAGTPATPLHMSPVTIRPGYLSSTSIAAAYAEATGADLRALDWYKTLALWKAAVFCEGIYARWKSGERPGDSFGPSLEAGVPRLLHLARAAL